MFRIFILLIIVVTLGFGCSSGRSGADRPGGMTGTSGTTTGTGTAAPSGTIGTGSTSDPASTGAVIPKEGEELIDPNDSVITTTVIARLKEAGFGDKIQVETDDGIVELKGTVSSQSDFEKIVKLVQGLPDVESVDTTDLVIQ